MTVSMGDILRGIVRAITPQPSPLPEPPSDRRMSTAEDVRWMQRDGERIKREAEMLGIDVRLKEYDR